MKKKRIPHWVYVRDVKEDEWLRRMFVEVIEDSKYSCVIPEYEKAYSEGKEYRIALWNYMRELEEMKLFRQKFFLADL